MSKFNPNLFRKWRIAIAVQGSANIRRIFCWCKQKQRYVDPPRGNKFEARRSSKVAGGRQTKTFASLQEARNWLSGEISLLSQKKMDCDYTVGDLVQDWQKFAWCNFAKNTRIFYANRLPILEPIEAVPVENLTPMHIDEWLYELKSPTWMNKYSSNRTTLEKEFDMFKTIINWYIDRNDHTKLIKPFKKRHSEQLRLRPAKIKSRKVMYDHELSRWLEELKKESFLYYSMALVQVHQVLRVSEVCAMKWSNLCLPQREYTVVEHVIWPRVNGMLPEILPGTKTNRNGESFVSFLQQESVTVLDQMKAMARNGDLIFTQDGTPLTYRQVQYTYDLAFKRAGLPFRGTHVCRHSGATSFLEKTGDVLALQQMGGWRNHKMALHYGQISSSRAKEATLHAERKVAELRLVKDVDAS